MGLKRKICPECKEKNNPSFNKCWKCGAPFGNIEEEQPKVHPADEELVPKI